MYYAIISVYDYGDSVEKEIHAIVDDEGKAIEMVKELNGSLDPDLNNVDIWFLYEARDETPINLDSDVIKSKYYVNSFERMLPKIVKNKFTWWNANKDSGKFDLPQDYVEYLVNHDYPIKNAMSVISEERMRYLIKTHIMIHGVGQ